MQFELLRNCYILESLVVLNVVDKLSKQVITLHR